MKPPVPEQRGFKALWSANIEVFRAQFKKNNEAFNSKSEKICKKYNFIDFRKHVFKSYLSYSVSEILRFEAMSLKKTFPAKFKLVISHSLMHV